MKKELQRKYRSLRKDLRGKYQDIADQCNVSKATVSNVLNGIFENEKVLSLSLKMRDEVLKQRQVDLEKKLERVA